MWVLIQSLDPNSEHSTEKINMHMSYYAIIIFLYIEHGYIMTAVAVKNKSEILRLASY